MDPTKKNNMKKNHGSVLIMAMILIVICSALAVSIAAMSNTNIQLASNQQKVNTALSAAQSGLECCRFLTKTFTLPSTNRNNITSADADLVWGILCQKLQNTSFDGKTVASAGSFTDAVGSGTQILAENLNYDDISSFTIRFYRYANEPNIIKIQSTGKCGETTQQVNMDMLIAKEGKVLSYAVAGRGRMWLTGQSTIHGDVFSTWNRAEIPPYNMTNDSSVLGTINTVLTLNQIKDESYQLETLNANNEPVDENWQPLGCDYEDRYYSEDDEIKAYHEGINYGQAGGNMPGMSIGDYNTDMYVAGLTDIAQCPSGDREVEYFPHSAGNYNYPRDGTPYSTSNLKLTRHVYENTTFSNAKLPSNRNALFRNCTFEEVLYIDCNKNTSSYYNNVRFENCTFNGVIVTNVPQSLKWMQNCLYFTGEAAFENTSSVQEATILAPHFNVNLGNTNPELNENNVLTGAIIGGIVDVRGNAQIYGTIISMADTSQWSSGYVTNIGATLDDGGSETTELGDIGVIDITPDQDQMLPSGITSPIIIKTLQNTYSEG
ncbi:MAG: pilus assembly PilX N-terminal domain-containing protein [Sedimentisphaerales bacterium]|nr:pilus assembly PilX N-terminal domain-containing protein [Sedimentisphaerales bacterium]